MAAGTWERATGSGLLGEGNKIVYLMDCSDRSIQIMAVAGTVNIGVSSWERSAIAMSAIAMSARRGRRSSRRYQLGEISWASSAILGKVSWEK